MAYQARTANFQHILEKPAFHYGLLAAITILAAGLRFYKLSDWSFWIDEIYTINRAINHFNLQTIIGEWYKPSFSVILTGGFLNLYGINEWNARFTSVLFGIATVPILFLLSAKLFDRYVGYTAAFLLAISPWHIHWSQNARFYTSLVLFYLIASVAIFLYIETGRIKYLILFGIFIVFAIGERYIAVLIGPVLVVYLVLLWIFPFEKPERFGTRAFTLLLIPGLAYMGMELLSLVTTGTTRIADTFTTFIGGVIDSPLRILIMIFFSIGTALVALGIYSAVNIIINKSRTGLYLLVNATVPILAVVIVSQYAFIVERYALITLPFWILLGAYAIRNLPNQLHGRMLYPSLAILLILFIDAFGSNLLYFQLNAGNRPEWRQAFQFVMDRAQKDDVIVSSVPEVGSYYTKRDVLPLRELTPQSVTQDSHDYWFVLDSENSWFAWDQKGWVEANADLVEIYYLRVREQIHLKIYYYDQEYDNPVW